jgi:hypothetical protein
MPHKTLKSIAYHRNGICGLGFHVAIIQEDDGDGPREMLVIRFSKESDKDTGQVVCAAFDLKLLDVRDIAFGSNSWRGENYVEHMDRMIKNYEKKENERVFGKGVV